MYTQTGKTALIYADEYGHTSAVKMLLDAGADVFIVEEVVCIIARLPRLTLFKGWCNSLDRGERRILEDSSGK